MGSETRNIRRSLALRKVHIDPKQYTLSLLQEGFNAGLIDEPAMAFIQTELMSLFKETIIKYTQGESTSLRAETAERILTSILYSVDALLSSFSDHEDALKYLIEKNVREIYQEGLDLTTLCFGETKKLYTNVAASKLKVELHAYNSTIDDALPEFFALYDLTYNAQDTWASMDYPLLFDDLTGSGIYYIKQYLEYLAIENYICSLFDPAAINKLLNNYGKVYRIDYRETLINLLEVLLTNSIFSVLSGNSALELCITKQQFIILREKFTKFDHSFCSSQIQLAIDSLLEELCIVALPVRDYIKKFRSLLMPRFISALENDNLTNIVIIDRNKDQSLNIIWDQGTRLNDDDFRLMVKQILECTTGVEKAIIINSSIHSLSDFIDVLEADCLFDAEYPALFKTLGDLELSILLRIVFAEELRIGGLDNLQQLIEEKQPDIPWQIEFASFLLGLSPERLRAIEYFIPAALQNNKTAIF